MRKRLSVFFLIFIYIFNNIFVSTTLCKFVQEGTTAKFSLTATAPNTLPDYSWEEIYDITVSGEARNHWKIGDKTTVKVNGEDKEVVIIGIDHDGENTVTFAFKESLGKAAIKDEANNSGSWEKSKMRTVTMPEILAQLENKEFIKEVEKKTIAGYADGKETNTIYDIRTTIDKLFLLSSTEVMGGSDNEGKQYEYFKTAKNRIIEPDTEGKGIYWWLRTPNDLNPYSFYYIYSDGGKTFTTASANCSVIPAFVIGETIDKPSNLALLPPFEMPENLIAGESFIISEMPNFEEITEVAINNTPEDTEYFGWLIESEFAQVIFEPEEAKSILEDTYSEGEPYELRLTPVYKVIMKTISITTELENITIGNLVADSMSNEENILLDFVVEEGYSMPETFEIIIDDISYVINTNGEDNVEGLVFDNELLELCIDTELISGKTSLVIKAIANLVEVEEETESNEQEELPNEEDDTLPEDELDNQEPSGDDISSSEEEKETIPNDTKEEIVEKTISFETDRLYNVEITEFIDLRRNELTIEEDLELEFVLEENYILYKNIEILINDNSYVLDLTDKEQELEGITFNEEDSILTISYDLFEKENTFNIVAIALEDIPTDELVLGEEISITEFIDVEELFKEIEILEDTEFIGWLINDENLEIKNIIISEEINALLTKIYENKEETNNEFIEFLDELLNNEEEIETLLIPVFRTLKTVDLDGYVLGDSTTIYELPEENALQEIVEFNLVEGLVFYGWLVETENTAEIILAEELFETLNTFIEDGKEIVLTPLYVNDEISEDPEEVEEETESNEQDDLPNEEDNTLPEDELDNQEPSGDDNSYGEDKDSEKSVEESTDGIPETSIPTEYTITVNISGLNNINIPELSKENTISLTNDENLIFSLETDTEYELPETVQIVVDKTYTINTNGENNPSEIEYNVDTQEIIIHSSLLENIDTIKVKGTATKVQVEENESTTEKSEITETDSSNKTPSAEEDTTVEPPVEDNEVSKDPEEVEEETESNKQEELPNEEDNILPEDELDNQELSGDDNSYGEDNVIPDTENIPSDIPEEKTEISTDNVENTSGKETLPENKEETEQKSASNNETSTSTGEEKTKDQTESNVVNKEETDKAESSTGVDRDTNSSNNKTPETKTESSEPVSQSKETQTNSSSSGSDSTSQSTTSSSNSSSESNSSSTSQSAGTTNKKSESSEGKSEQSSGEE